MITVTKAAQLCAEIYDDESKWTTLWEAGGFVMGHIKLGEDDVLVCRGSKSAQDWLLDAAGGIPIFHPQIGICAAGFITGLEELFAEAAMVVGARVIVVGHSLGGARARLLAARFAVAGHPVDQCCVFGSPRPGFVNIRRILEKSGTKLQSFRNRNDVVPEMPPMFPLPFAHTDEWVSFDEAPDVKDLEVLRDHHIPLYIAGALKYDAQP